MLILEYGTNYVYIENVWILKNCSTNNIFPSDNVNVGKSSRAELMDWPTSRQIKNNKLNNT